MSIFAKIPNILDPGWRRVPFPARPSMTVATHGPVTMLRMERTFFGRSFLPVYCYAIGDTLVDTGISSLGHELAAFARSRDLKRAFITHHHEDHAGNAARLARDGLRVETGARTADILRRPYAIRFYQHLMWGAMPAAQIDRIDERHARIEIAGREAWVIPAPGHCEDQVVFFVPSEGWLFSGDAFIHEQVRLFRKDEDFALTVATLEKLLTYDFDVLFCAHRPRTSNGHAALAAKLGWFREIEARTRELHARGDDVHAIVRRLALGQRSLFPVLTFGDVSAANLVRSILFGPTPRADARSRG